MVEPLRHRQSKEAATDMFSLQPPRHISTLPSRPIAALQFFGPYWGVAYIGMRWSSEGSVANDPKRN